MAKLNISLAQMQIAYGDVRKNVNNMLKLVEEAARRGSKMIVLPELWSTGYDLENAKDYASQLNQGLFAQLSTAATQSKIAIVGSIMESRGLSVSNSAPFFAPTGRMLGVYRKIHLFRLMKEDEWLQSGSSPLVVSLPWGPTGIGICYDLRFPELFRRYALEGAVMCIIPAEWPAERIDHWRALLIARAIENQCYIVATNAVGKTGNTVFGGHSMIVDPWGNVVVEAGNSPQLITAEIEMDMIDEVRERIPVFEDRRDDVY